MGNDIYSIPSYFPYAQGNKWTYAHKRGEEVSAFYFKGYRVWLFWGESS